MQTPTTPPKWQNIFFNRDYKTNAIHLVRASLIINLLALAMPIMMFQAYDRILPNLGYFSSCI